MHSIQINFTLFLSVLVLQHLNFGLDFIVINGFRVVRVVFLLRILLLHAFQPLLCIITVLRQLLLPALKLTLINAVTFYFFHMCQQFRFRHWSVLFFPLFLSSNMVNSILGLKFLLFHSSHFFLLI